MIKAVTTVQLKREEMNKKLTEILDDRKKIVQEIKEIHIQDLFRYWFREIQTLRDGHFHQRVESLILERIITRYIEIEDRKKDVLIRMRYNLDWFMSTPFNTIISLIRTQHLDIDTRTQMERAFVLFVRWINEEVNIK